MARALLASTIAMAIFASLARAQTVPPPPPPATAEPATPVHATVSDTSDEVSLRSGETVRGVIAEYAPDGAVTIRTTSGEVRVYPSEAVRSVVLAEARASAAPPPPVVPVAAQPTVRRARVHFVASSGTPLDLHVETGAFVPVSPEDTARLGTTYLRTRFRHLCRTPCDASALAGAQLFGVGADDGAAPVPASSLVRVVDGATIEASMEDRSATRTIGVVVSIVGAVVGAGLAIAAIVERDDPEAATTLAVSAGLVAIGSAGVGAVMMLQDDDVSVRALHAGRPRSVP